MAGAGRGVVAALGLVMAWALTRGLVVWLLQDPHAWVTGDLAYFVESLAAVPEQGLERTLVEYPLPGVVVVALPWFLAAVAGAPEAYEETVLALSLAADAAFALLLVRLAGPRRWHAVTVWLLAVPLVGATAYARFDLVPGLLAGVALLLLVRRPGAAAAAGAVATALKFWPALLLPALAAPSRSRRRVVTVVAVTGVVLAGASLVVASPARLVSPLSWQSERGLQVEAVAATPAMVRWALDPGRYAVAYTEHNAFEVDGPVVPALLDASEVATLVLALLLVALWLLAWRGGGELPAGTVAWLSLAGVAGFMVTSKVLSPQYLLWLLPLAAAAVATVDSRPLRLWSGVLLVAAGLTQLVFPVLYAHLLRHGILSGEVVGVLAIRNALLVVLFVWAAVQAVRAVSAAARSSASRPAPRGTPHAASGDGPTTPT